MMKVLALAVALARARGRAGPGRHDRSDVNRPPPTPGACKRRGNLPTSRALSSTSTRIRSAPAGALRRHGRALPAEGHRHRHTYRLRAVTTTGTAPTTRTATSSPPVTIQTTESTSMRPACRSSRASTWGSIYEQPGRRAARFSGPGFFEAVFYASLQTALGHGYAAARLRHLPLQRGCRLLRRPRPDRHKCKKKKSIGTLGRQEEEGCKKKKKK